MNDQATKLRELINAKKIFDVNKKNQVNINTDQARTICITSGKGGVGKTNFTVNLAIALSKYNLKVVILDADLGLANVDVTLGILSKYNLLDLITNNMSVLDIMTDGPNGIKIISGGSGILELVNLNQHDVNNLISKIEIINDYADVILIDTGAGLSNSVISFALAAEEIIVIATPEPPSITDAYAMIKTIKKRDKNKRIRIVINRADSESEGKIAFNKLKYASERFLNTSIEKLGIMREDPIVSRSIKLQQPLILQYPNSLISKNIECIASKLLNKSSINYEKDRENFFARVVKLFK
ncbi:MAG: ATP-binding protein [Alkaliphilus sp.]|nr:MinD/ParA family protein [Alkaliphilus transvaalensis]PHS35264.1 MAG: ATP-binding protein [Alkaliphilus sp.]